MARRLRQPWRLAIDCWPVAGPWWPKTGSDRPSSAQPGLTFHYTQDQASQQTETVGFQVTALRVGRQSLLNGPLTLRHEDNWAWYDDPGGLWQLAYEVGDETVGHYLRLDEALPLNGDLVIEGTFATSLQPVLVSQEEGIRFRPARGEATENVLGYSPAVALDAGGRRLALAMALNGRTVQLTLPQAWLARAEFPIVIDPLIGPADLISGLQGDAQAPATASDGDHILTVWDWQGDIYGQLVDSSGVLSGSLISISQAEGVQHKATAVYNPVSGEYLVAWVDRRYGSPNYSLLAQRLSVTGTLLGEALEVTPPLQNLGSQGGVSGAASAGGEILLVWAHQESNYDIFGQILSPTGELTGTRIALTPGQSKAQQGPVVAYEGQSDRFLVIWEDYRSDSEYGPLRPAALRRWSTGGR